ncbi:MAG: biopolymer transporter ExbD [Flavobacteriales bacterium]|nr:biopolymer transporter ExbD [Flavobacteriales bacterium]
MDFGRRNKVSAESNMASIADLVFLLLIFFIIMSTMVVNGEQVDLPQTKGVEPSGANAVTLTITEDLRFLVDNVELPKEQVELRLKAILESRTDKLLVLNIDRWVPTGETIEMVSIAKINGWKVVVATKPQEKE